MYNSSYYKSEAKKRLHGGYAHAIAGALIYMIPLYLTYLVTFVLTKLAPNATIIGDVLTVIISVFVTNIFLVGFNRFLITFKSEDECGPDEKRCDLNNVLSGYTMNFKNTLKTTLLRDVYLFCWGLLMISPMLVIVGIIAYLAATTDRISEMYSLITQLITSPTPDMAANVTAYIEQYLPYLSIMILAASLLSLVLIIPFIIKTYEYTMIPTILAEYPDMDTKEVFMRTKTIMSGFKWRYFLLQMSFFLWLFLTGMVFSFTLSIPLYYLAQAALMPYMNMTFISFYKERSSAHYDA